MQKKDPGVISSLAGLHYPPIIDQHLLLTSRHVPFATQISWKEEFKLCFIILS